MSVTELEKKELTQGQMDEGKGGLIVDRGFWRNYWLVNDYTGELVTETFFKYDAKNLCKSYTLSDTIVSEESYNAWMEKKRKAEHK